MGYNLSEFFYVSFTSDTYAFNLISEDGDFGQFLPVQFATTD